MKTILDDCYAAYVNLDKRPERRAGMEKALRGAGIKASRHRGILPTEYKDDPARIKAMYDRPQKGAIGCHFAQVGIMTKALNLEKHAFVMEDDLVFCSDFQDRLKMLSDFGDHYEWDIFWLGATFHINPPYWHINATRGCVPLGRDAELTFHSRIIRTYGCFCTYAYIVNRSSIQKILDMMMPRLPTSIGIDHMMIMLQPELFTFSFVPGCIKQYDHNSDIGLGVTRFSNFATLNKTCRCSSPSTCAHSKENLAKSAYWWQDRMEDFNPTTFNWHEANTDNQI